MDCFTDRCEIMKNVGYLLGEVNFPQGVKAKDVIKIASAKRSKQKREIKKEIKT
jgi:ABC-type multidrug transport system ATPase subunit